jgi:hypothetical protein
MLHTQTGSDWTFELDLRPFMEPWSFSDTPKGR